MNDHQQARFSEAAIPAAVIMGVFAFILFAMLGMRTHVPYTPPTTEVAVIQPTATRIQELPTPVPGIVYSGEVISQGQSYFGSTCSACHGSDARGVPGLGKDLIDNPFVNDMTDQALHDFIVTGRPAWDPENTTGIDMPPKGGNPALSDENIFMIIAYLRTTKDPALAVRDTSLVAESTPVQIAEARPTEPFVMPVQPQYNVTPEPHPFDPAFAYAWSCSGCHGLDGRGVPGAGPDLFTGSSVLGGSSEQVLNFLTTAQPWANPEESFTHPIYGGYPELSDEQLQQVIDYLLTLPTRQ